MNKFLPDMYQKDIFSINYKNLKAKGIEALAFDFDNTILENNEKQVNKKTIELFKSLNKDFKVIVVSNTIKVGKVKTNCEMLGINYIYFSLKPLSYGFNKAKKILKVLPNEICFIGDQFYTDIVGANKMNFVSCLVDPINVKESTITKIKRILEKNLLKKLLKYGFEVKKYYE